MPLEISLPIGHYALEAPPVERLVPTAQTRRPEAAVEGRQMREPYVVPIEKSPLALDVSARERRERRLAQSSDVWTDESQMMIAFSGEGDVDALLNDPRFGAIAMPMLELCGVTQGPLHELWSLLMFGMDGEEHKRLRGSVAREFTPRAVEKYRNDIERFASDLADDMNGTVELWSAFALPLSARSTCRVVGVPIEDSDRVASWSPDLVNAFFFMSQESALQAEAAAVEILPYLDDIMRLRREAPGDDVMSKLVATDAAHDLTYDETRALVANLLFGGLEATAKVITTGTFHLLHENRWHALVESPELASHAVAELLRFAPPTNVARFAREDLVCQDVQLHAGQLVLLDLSAACRDARRYRDPDNLDVTRESGRQLAFGAGAHFCLGANLAKLVLEVAFATMASRFPNLRFTSTADDIEWDFETFEGVVALPVNT
jgi:cytochrome P450